jgi:nicotinamide riboside transporter PnuC
MGKYIINKILSGRFLFTMIAALVFAILSIQGRLPTDKVMEVVLIVIYAYFQRGDRTPNNQQNKEGV